MHTTSALKERSLNDRPRPAAVTAGLRCTRCAALSDLGAMIPACPACAGPLEYVFDGVFEGPRDRPDQWRFFDLMPLRDPANIVSLGEGASDILELPELSACLGGARLSVKLDAAKNPTGTFKDREASLVISRCVELGLDHLVFYSTGNTGRAYTHYAAQRGLTTYFFMPRHAHYKQTASFAKGANNFLLLVDDEYQAVGPYAKKFAAANGLALIAPLHDRTEAYAAVAYEQHEQMPECDWFAQTIASGMGPIGFLRGHRNLVKLGLEAADRIPRIACIQSEETNSMYRAYGAGRTAMTAADLPAEPRTPLFEPTLNSTNPVANYPDLHACLNATNGAITDVSPAYVNAEAQRLIDALEKRHVRLQYDLERSLLIGFAGLVRLADARQFSAGERILLLGTGRGGAASSDLVPPDAVVRPSLDDPRELKARLATPR